MRRPSRRIGENLEEMTREDDLVARASKYVLGLMEENDRERAERDLEIDPIFREAVLRVAEHMQLLDLNPAGVAHPDFWRAISTRIGHLPQMRAEMSGVPARAPIPLYGANGFQLAGALIVTFLAGYLAGLATWHLW